ncbi:MAG: hypothetical protein J6O39_00545 [Treponema sp.]|nr:hypothetical protein [Treponema sp.]
MLEKLKFLLLPLAASAAVMTVSCSSDDSGTLPAAEEKVSLSLDKSGELSLTGVIPCFTTETFRAVLKNAEASVAFTASSSAVEACGAGSDYLTVDFLLPGTSTITASAIVDGEIYSDSVAVTVAFADASECGLTLSAPEDELGQHSAQVTWAALDSSYGSLDCYILALYDSEENLVYLEKIEADEASDTNTVSWTDLTAQSAYTAKVYTVFTKDNLTSYGLSTVSFSTTDDTTAPGEVTLTSAAANRTTISLEWTNPSDDDFAAIIITPYEMASGASEYSALDAVTITDTSVTTYDFMDLTVDSTYKYLIQTQDETGNLSDGVTSDEICIDADVTAPGEVTITSASTSGTGVSLAWTNPSDDDFAAIVITPYQKAAETSAYSALDAVTITDTSVTSYNFADLTPASYYKYLIQTKDETDNVSDGVTSDAIFISGDSPVTDLAITNTGFDYSGYLTLTWTDPSDTDFNSISISYSCDGENYTTKTVAAGVGTLALEDLAEVGSDFTFTVKSLDSESNVIGAATVTGQPSKQTIRFFNKSTSKFLNVSDGAVTATTTKYYWLKRKALDGTSSVSFTATGDNAGTRDCDTFSLEMMDTEGKATGKYLYLASVSTSVGSTATAADIAVAEKETAMICTVDGSTEVNTGIFATFFLDKGNDYASGYYALRTFYDNGNCFFMIGNSSSTINYRSSQSTPGVGNWEWKYTLEEGTTLVNTIE